MATIVRIHSQDLDKIDREAGQYAFSANWDLPRRHTLSYLSEETGRAIADEAFHILNAPDFALNVQQQQIAQYNRDHSLSVGDVVEAEGIEYMCAPMGWVERRIA